MLADFYEKYKVSDKDMMPLEKNVLLVIPHKSFDISPFLSKLGLSKHEVAVTYPKKTVNMLMEISSAKPRLVIQLGERLSRKFKFAQTENDIDSEMVEGVKDCLADYFVNFHHHDEFSIKDGLGTVEQLVKLLKAQRRSFCCVTNHGSVGGWIKQYNACRKSGIKAVFGCEVYRSDYRGDDMEEKKKHRSANHLVLLARTMEGFENIIRIHNDAQINGFYYTPRVNREALEQYGKGVIGSSACLAGDIPQFLLNGEKEKAIEAYQFYSRVFDRFYIEIQLIEYGVQQNANRLLIQFAKEVRAPLLVSLDCLESNTNVIMDNGSVKKIKDVVVGDFVSTDDGGSSVVEAVGKRKARDGERVFRICSGTKKHSITCTEDHPFLIEFGTGRREWVKAVDLRKGDYLVVPHPVREKKRIVLRTEDYFEKNQCIRKVGSGWISTRTDKAYTVPEYIEVDKEFCWVLGLYIAEGYRDNYVTGFGLHRDEDFYAGKANTFFRKYGFNPTIEKHPVSKSQTVRISSFGFAPLFSKLCGDGCSNKKLPYFWKNLDDECLLALLDGYFCGDGCYSKETLSCLSVSESLIYQIQQAMLSLGFYSNICTNPPRRDKRTNNFSKESYVLHYGNEQINRMKPFFSKIGKVDRKKICNKGSVNKGLYHLVLVSGKEEVIGKDECDFWDISVRDRHCFVAESRVVHNSHYLEAEHAETHDILMCVRQHKTLTETEGDESADVWSFDVRNLYYRNVEQMFDLFDKGFVERNGTVCPPLKDDVFTEEVLAEAMANTLNLARETEEIKLDSTIKLPKLYDDAKGILREKINKGFRARGLDKVGNTGEYLERARHEYDVITKLGWTDYFLIVEEIVSYAKDKFGEFSVGYGRGSAGGSLISYCLGITDVDPLKYGLLFERFLDESRPTPPDIDLDFDPDIREELKQHIVAKFGEDHVCSIGTYQTYRTKAVILDVARALGKNVGEANEVTKGINPLEAIEDADGEEHKVDNLGFDEIGEHYPELKAYFASNPDVRHHAEILRNQVKNMGTHAGGVIISDISLKGKIPVLYDKPSSTEKKIISAWAESGSVEELSSVGLVKFDILGLNNLPIVSQCLRLIEENRGIKIKRSEVPIDDGRTIHLASKKDLVGIFQLDNPATKSVVDDVQIGSLTDVAVVTSLIRPGPRDMKMDKEYARRKRGEDYDAPEIIKTLLAETYGVIVFQEQCMKIVQVISGFTPAESYKFLKAVAKKKADLMASFKSKFIEGAQSRVDDRELTKDEVETIFGLLEKFAGYGFNASHAYEYSALSCAELWLKYNYPTEYITSLINNTSLSKKKHGSDIFVDYINYARRSGIEVLPPDVSKSKSAFEIDDGKIRFSLAHIKTVASMAPVIEAAQPFASVEDFYDRAKADRRPNKGVVESLIAAGAFNSFGTKNEVVAEYYRLRASKKEVAPQYSDEEWVELEKEAIGLCLSKPPLFRQYEKLIKEKGWKLISEVSTKRATVFGTILEMKPTTSKTGNPMYVVTMSDGVDTQKFFVFTGAKQGFSDNFKVGTIAAIPLDKFEDSDTRFFDDRKSFEVVVK